MRRTSTSARSISRRKLALLIGNLFAYAVEPEGSLRADVGAHRAIGRRHATISSSDRRGKLAFQAGQYLEWTLGLDRADNRGNRRYFTVASAPTEESVRLGVKFYPASSAFKRGAGAMKPGDTIHASQVAGDFTLPANPETKLAFLAGGIGITPFRSMLQYLLDRKEARPIVVLYGNESQQDIAYRDVLDAAERELGIRTVYAVARGASVASIPATSTRVWCARRSPTIASGPSTSPGPQAMVKALRHMLRAMGVRRSRIKVDFFPGFA